jgi:hypothetical protein
LTAKRRPRRTSPPASPGPLPPIAAGSGPVALGLSVPCHRLQDTDGPPWKASPPSTSELPKHDPACNRWVVSVDVAMHEEHAASCRSLCRPAGSHSGRAASFSGCDSPCRLVSHLWRFRHVCRERQRDWRDQEHLRSCIRFAQSVSRCGVVDDLREGLGRCQFKWSLHSNNAHPEISADAVLPPVKLLGRYKRSAVG